MVVALLVVLYVFRKQIQGLLGGGKKTGNASAANGGGGFGGGSMGGGSTTPVNSVNVGPYTVPGATVAEGYSNIGYKPQQGEGVQALPMQCISDAFAVNGVDYCIALDSRGNEVTLKIS